MDNDILRLTEELAEKLRQSPEYLRYISCKERAYADETTRMRLTDYAKLQYKLQAASLSGNMSEEELTKLQKLGELLQLNSGASEYLFAQYALNSLVSEVYSKLGQAVGIDLSMFEA